MPSALMNQRVYVALSDGQIVKGRLTGTTDHGIIIDTNVFLNYRFIVQVATIKP
jgi:small nuclear ribonucleoprotein (snRNP)-like protein